jgi:hypothetical protein
MRSEVKMNYLHRNLTGFEVFFVGDIIKGVPTGYPHLDEVGDTGTINDKNTNLPIAKYVVVKTYPDPKTNERLTKDIQLVESLNSKKCLFRDEARCFIHFISLPCEKCKELEKRNYG